MTNKPGIHDLVPNSINRNSSELTHLQSLPNSITKKMIRTKHDSLTIAVQLSHKITKSKHKLPENHRAITIGKSPTTSTPQLDN